MMSNQLPSLANVECEISAYEVRDRALSEEMGLSYGAA